MKITPKVWFLRARHTYNYERNNLLVSAIVLALVIIVIICITNPFPYKDWSIYDASKSSVCTKPTGDFNILGSGVCYNEKVKQISFVQFTNWTQIDLCSVVSAIKKNPEHSICILQGEGVRLRDAELREFRKYSNIHIMKLDILKLFEGTTVKDWYVDSCAHPEKNRVLMSQVADAARFVYLYEYGGISLDTDCFVLTPLDSYKNTICMENHHIINNGVLMGFDRHNPLIKECIDFIVENVEPNGFGTAGPFVLTKVFKKRRARLGNKDLVDGIINILPAYVFYPLHLSDKPWPYLAASYDKAVKLTSASATLHLYRSHFTMFTNKGQLQKGSFVEKFMREECGFET